MDGNTAGPISPDLEGTDAMAFNFLTKAANAIVSASTLAKQLAEVSAKLSSFETHNATLEEIKANQEDRIATLESQLREALAYNERLTTNYDEAKRSADQRQNDVYLLDQTVEKLRDRISELVQERDEIGFKHLEACEIAEAAQAKLRKIQETLGLPVDQPSPALAEHTAKQAEVEAAFDTTQVSEGVEEIKRTFDSWDDDWRTHQPPNADY